MFNAIRYTQELEKAGFTRQQAEATVNMVHQFAEHNLATREDIVRLEHAMVVLEHRLTIKMGAMFTVAIGLIVTLQKLL